MRCHDTKIYSYIELNFNLTLVYTIPTYFPLIFACNGELLTYLFTCSWNDKQTCENNMSKFSECEPHHKHKLEPQDIVQHKYILLKSFVQRVHASLMDNSMDNSNMVTLSMEPRKQIVTLHNNYWLTFYSINCRHFMYLPPEVVQLLANQCRMWY